ncbi:MAG: N-acetylglucosamine-6-phosphate deacetylase [Bdellovibrionota bacterium]
MIIDCVFKNVTIFDGKYLQENKTVFISKEKILDVIECQAYSKKNCVEIEGNGNILVPGFIDIQVNGGGGYFFNDEPRLACLQKIRDAHLQYGTTSILPTFISDSFQKMKQALLAVQEACHKFENGILGIHLEGPYLNLQKNGIHNKKNIRPPLKQEIDYICQFPLPIKLVTLAPELISKSILEELQKNNVFIFAGHTNATFEEMQQAFASGVVGITHFFNACSPFLSRAPGVVGAGLLNNEIWCGLIADGLHVSFDSIKIAFKAKSTTHFILVSDAMSPVGTDISEFSIHDQKIMVKKNSSIPTYVDQHGTLAGSALTMHQALKNIVLQNCASLSEALAMTSTNPAKCLHLEAIKGRIQPNYDADVVLLNKDNLNLIHVMQSGAIIK